MLDETSILLCELVLAFYKLILINHVITFLPPVIPVFIEMLRSLYYFVGYICVEGDGKGEKESVQ